MHFIASMFGLIFVHRVGRLPMVWSHWFHIYQTEINVFKVTNNAAYNDIVLITSQKCFIAQVPGVCLYCAASLNNICKLWQLVNKHCKYI
jgi:hypothetical protein